MTPRGGREYERGLEWFQLPDKQHLVGFFGTGGVHLWASESVLVFHEKKNFVAFRIIPFLYPGSAYPHHTCIPSYQIKLFHSFRPVILHDSIPTFIPFWCMCNDLIFDKKKWFTSFIEAGYTGDLIGWILVSIASWAIKRDCPFGKQKRWRVITLDIFAKKGWRNTIRLCFYYSLYPQI
jgi:hypothetical protein